MKSRPAPLYLVPPPLAGTHTSDVARMSEDALVDGLRREDPKAQGAAYRLYARDVWRVLYRTLGDDAELADLHQEVFVHVFRGAPGFRREASLKTWITRIAVLRVRKRIRSMSRRRWLRFMPAEELPEAISGSVDDDAALEARAVYDLLSRMPADERIAFALHYVDGMTLQETALVTQCSKGTVKRRISRAKQRFVAMATRHPALASFTRTGEDQ